MLHIETLNMMTKYQLVFLKLETALSKMSTNMEERRRLRVRLFFNKFRENALVGRLLIAKRQSLLTARIRSTLSELFQKVRTGKAGVLKRALNTWKVRTKQLKKSEEVEQKSQKRQWELDEQRRRIERRLEEARKRKEEIVES